jgi:Leucine-rich repeat (LRR) protein
LQSLIKLIKLCRMRLLKTLDLSNNDLSDLPSELGILPKLTRINIEGNALKTIKSSMRTAGAEVLKKYLVTRIAGTKYLLPKVMSLN